MAPPQPIDWRSLLALAVGLTVPLAVAAVVPVHVGLATYLPLHSLMELFAVVVAVTVGAVGWNAAGPARSPGLTLLAVGFLGVATFDVFHLLSYQGMPDLVTPSSPSKAIWFWLAARFTAVLSLLGYATAPRRVTPRLGLMVGVGAVVAAVTWFLLVHEAALPTVFVAGTGLTPFKRTAELLLVLGSASVVPFLLFSPTNEGSLVRRDQLASAVVAMAVSELAFCFYQDVTDGFNLVGHLEKIVAYALLYRAVFRAAVREPYLRLAASVAEAKESEARFRELASAIDEVFFLTDAHTGRLLYTSPAATAVWARSVAELERAPEGLFTFVHPDDRGRVAALREVRQDGERAETVRILRPDGAARWVALRTGPVRDGTGAVYRLAGVARDVTHEKALQAQLGSAQRMETVSRLAAGVAHDFNNLLTVILTATSFAKEATQHLDAELREDVASIEAAARRAQALTRQLLTLARRDRSPAGVVDLGAVLRDLLPMIERLVGVDVAVRAELAAGDHPVVASPSQLEQLIVNFAVNARDAMPSGGTLRFEVGPAEAGEPRVVLRVIDTGVGMTEEVRERAFEPFYTTKPEGQGTGLGLATCYGIVRELGGELLLDSAVGVGTRVAVALPRATRPAAVDTPVPPVRRGRGEPILVVDDEPAVLKSAARALAAQGFAPIAAASGAEALERLASLPELPLLLTDVRMPGMGGLELARRAQAARPGLRVLFMSGYADQDVPDGLLPKPFTTDDLAEAVRRQLDGAAPR